MSNPIKDKLGFEIQLGDIVSYYDSTTMWLTGKVVDIGSALAIETAENPIPLYEFVRGYVYDGQPIAELLIINRNVQVEPDGRLSVAASE